MPFPSRVTLNADGATGRSRPLKRQRTSLRVLGLQEDLVWQDPQANRTSLENRIDAELAKSPADLVVLPEMFTTGFSMSLEHVEGLDEQGLSTTSRWMLQLASQHNVAITGSVAVRDLQGASFNRMWFATPEGDLHAYDKRHLFTLAGEGEVYQPGVDRVELTWRGWRILLASLLRFALSRICAKPRKTALRSRDLRGQLA